MAPRTPQIPGQPVVDTTTDDETTQDKNPVAEETVEVPKAKLEALMARIDALEKAPAPSVTRRANPDAHLPDQKDIDPKAIKSPQLSKQGWVVPESLGANPNAKGL